MFAFGNRAVSASTQELQQRLEAKEKVTVIDVREPWEYAEGHVPGALLRPLGQIRTWIREFNPEQEIYLICRTANRSGSAYQFMQTMGFTKLRNVSGGMVAWRGPIER